MRRPGSDAASRCDPLHCRSSSARVKPCPVGCRTIRTAPDIRVGSAERDRTWALNSKTAPRASSAREYHATPSRGVVKEPTVEPTPPYLVIHRISIRPRTLDAVAITGILSRKMRKSPNQPPQGNEDETLTRA